MSANPGDDATPAPAPAPASARSTDESRAARAVVLTGADHLPLPDSSGDTRYRVKSVRRVGP
jgi:hypothetical protein